MPRLTSTDRRRAVLDAALAAFGEAAYDDVAVSEVARTAGVAQGLPFHYYGSKRGLYLAVVERLIADIDEIHPVPERGAEQGPAVREVLRRHRAYVEGHPLVLGLVANGQSLDPEVRAAVERSQQRGAERLLLTIGIEHPGATLRLLVHAWQAFHDQFVADWLRDRPFPEADLLRLLCGSLADLLEGARDLEPENVARVDLASLRD